MAAPRRIQARPSAERGISGSVTSDKNQGSASLTLCRSTTRTRFVELLQVEAA